MALPSIRMLKLLAEKALKENDKRIEAERRARERALRAQKDGRK